MESIWDSKFLNLVVDSQMLLGLDNIDANKGQRDEADNFNCKTTMKFPALGFVLLLQWVVMVDRLMDMNHWAMGLWKDNKDLPVT